MGALAAIPQGKRMRIVGFALLIGTLALSACRKPPEEVDEDIHKIVATTAMKKDVTLTQRYVCQIHSQKHIKVCALESGYLEDIPIKEGQTVKQGDLLFKVLPTLYKARYDAEKAEAELAQLEYNNTQRLLKDKVVSVNELALHQAKLAKAQAKANLALAELNFTQVQAPFGGIVDRLLTQQGSLVKEGDVLTTLSDNSQMWVYFNVPEARYLDYMAMKENERPREVELELANGSRFPHKGTIRAIEAQFNNETGNIPFRADFVNPDRLLRHGQTGNILIRKELKDAIIIPQRATFEILEKIFVWVVDKDGVIHQREVGIQSEIEDIFLVKSGLALDEKIVIEGVRQVREGQKVDIEFLAPEKAFANLKYRAE